MTKKTKESIEIQNSDAYMNLISKPEISFWVPIVTSAVVISMSWLNLSTRIDLLAQKMDLVIQNQQITITHMQEKDVELEVKYAAMQKQWGELSQRVTRIER